MRHHAPAQFEAGPGPRGPSQTLVQAWGTLGDTAVLPTQHPDFLLSAIAAFLDAAPLEVIDLGGPGAVASLVRDDRRFSRWRLVGDREVHEPGVPLFRDAPAAQLLADLLCAQDRALEFTRVPASSLLIPAMQKAAKGRGMLAVRAADPSPFLELDESWCEPASQFSSRRRSDFRRAQRKAEEFGDVTYAMERPTPDSFDALFEEAVAVEAKSWKREAGSAIICDEAKLAFFRRYLRACSGRGEARIATMRIDGELVAMHLAVAWRERYWLYKIGFDEAYARCSPGTLLMLHAMGEAAREGLTAFEMMGESDTWISDFWTRDAHDCVRMRFYPRTIAGFSALAEDGTEWLKARISNALSIREGAK